MKQDELRSYTMVNGVQSVRQDLASIITVFTWYVYHFGSRGCRTNLDKLVLKSNTKLLMRTEKIEVRF